MMSENKISTFIRAVTVPVSQPAPGPDSGSLFTQLLTRLSGRLASWRKGVSPPGTELECSHGHLRHAEEGLYRISDEEARRERTIDTLSVDLMFPRR